MATYPAYGILLAKEKSIAEYRTHINPDIHMPKKEKEKELENQDSMTVSKRDGRDIIIRRKVTEHVVTREQLTRRRERLVARKEDIEAELEAVDSALSELDA